MNQTVKGGTRSRRSAIASRPVVRRDLDPDVLAALEEQRGFLLRSLEDLEREHEAGDVDDADYASLKDDYTARAAGVIKMIDERHAALASSRPRRRWSVILGVGAAVLLIGLGAGWLVAASSGEREPGGTITGGIRESTINELAKAADYTAQATVAQERGDSDAAVTAYQNALGSYSAVLDQQPDNVEALTYRGWLLHVLALQAPDDVAARLDADALDSISRAVATDPRYVDARIFRAIILEGLGRTAEAGNDLDAVDPTEVPPGMSQMVETLRDRVEGSIGQPGG